MSLLSKLIVAIFVALIISQGYTVWLSAPLPNFDLFGVFSLATLLTVTFTAFRLKKRPTKSNKKKKVNNDGRSKGTVKWFNGSKGFGFITMESGEEIFVHFRSIRGTGSGRRILRDGQQVTLRVSSSSKGTQAEDVEIIGK